MRRRDLLTLFGGAVASWPLPGAGQTTRRPLIGGLAAANRTAAKPQADAFMQGMRDLGYVEGRDFDYYFRGADGHNERLPQLAREIVTVKPDVIYANPTPSVVAVRSLTQTIPIVSFMLADEIRLGLAVSDARPGKNVTGLLMRVEGMAGKQIELATEIVSHAQTIGILFNPSSDDAQSQRKDAERAARKRSLQTLFVEAQTPVAIEDAIRSIVRQKVDVGIALYDALFFSNRYRLAELANDARLPIVFSARDHVDAGGLISYGVSLRANARRSATYIDKILKGTKPGDLPLEFPTTLELVINLKTARTLGLTVPPALLARADEVIE